MLTSIKVLSRFAFAIPVQRKDTSNMTNAVNELLRQLKEHLGHYLQLAHFNNGEEFYNIAIKTLEIHKIEYFSTKSDKKSYC